MTRFGQYFSTIGLFEAFFHSRPENSWFVVEWSFRLPYYLFVEGIDLEFQPFTENAVPFYGLAFAGWLVVFAARLISPKLREPKIS